MRWRINKKSRKEGSMKYRICQRCGAHLDYGERCDCEERREYVADIDEIAVLTDRDDEDDTFTDWTEKGRKTA